MYFGCVVFLFRRGKSEIYTIEPLPCAMQSVTLLGGTLMADFEGLTSHFAAMSCFSFSHVLFHVLLTPVLTVGDSLLFGLYLFEFFLF